MSCCNDRHDIYSETDLFFYVRDSIQDFTYYGRIWNWLVKFDLPPTCKVRLKNKIKIRPWNQQQAYCNNWLNGNTEGK
jgi:hypothetical protein